MPPLNNNMAINVVEWAGVMSSMAGSILNARGQRCSFILWTVSALLLGFVAVHFQRTGWLALQVFGIGINSYGLYSWQGNAPVRE